jgi:hypothetical protein
MGHMGPISALATHKNLGKQTEYESKTTVYEQKNFTS